MLGERSIKTVCIFRLFSRPHFPDKHRKSLVHLKENPLEILRKLLEQWENPAKNPQTHRKFIKNSLKIMGKKSFKIEKNR